MLQAAKARGTPPVRLRPMGDTRDSEFTFVVSERDANLSEALDRGLTLQNLAATGVDEEKSFAMRVEATDGSIVGGLTGWIWGYTSGISKVWIHDDCRGKGSGSRLLSSAETEVRRHGCRRIFVSSFTFQAPDFYRRHGFDEIARVPGVARQLDGTTRPSV